MVTNFHSIRIWSESHSEAVPRALAEAFHRAIVTDAASGSTESQDCKPVKALDTTGLHKAAWSPGLQSALRARV